MNLISNPVKIKSQKIIWLLIAALFVLIILLIKMPEQIKKLVHDDGYNQLWQVALASIGGGFISLAFAELKREQDAKKEVENRKQEQREIRRQYFKLVHSRVISENNKVKKCRRLLRASRVKNGNEECVNLSKYLDVMESLEDSQLEFESLKREMELPTFKPPDVLRNCFDKMEKYLNNVLERFEEGNYPKDDLPVLSDFDSAAAEFITHYPLEKRKDAPFFREFVDSIKLLEKTLIEEISK